MEKNDVLIPCKVSPGQFPSERIVTLRLTDGKALTFFADSTLIQSKNGSCFLKVTRINSGLSAKRKEELVLLPTEPFESGSRWLRLAQDNQLAAA